MKVNTNRVVKLCDLTEEEARGLSKVYQQFLDNMMSTDNYTFELIKANKKTLDEYISKEYDK